MTERIPFVVIGENVHATRSYARAGKNVGVVGGTEHVLFTDVTGAARACPIAEPVAQSADYAKGVKHIRNALLLGLRGDGVLDTGRTGAVTPDAAQTANNSAGRPS